MIPRGATLRGRTAARRRPTPLPVLRRRTPPKRSPAKAARTPLAGVLAGAGVGALALFKRRRDRRREEGT